MYKVFKVIRFCPPAINFGGVHSTENGTLLLFLLIDSGIYQEFQISKQEISLKCLVFVKRVVKCLS